jgi:hypothetical protein
MSCLSRSKSMLRQTQHHSCSVDQGEANNSIFIQPAPSTPADKLLNTLIE